MPGPARASIGGIASWTFYFGPLLSVPLLFLPWIVRDRRMRLPLAVTGWMLLVLAVEDSRYPHYLSAVLVALLLISLQGIRHMRAAGRNSPAWLALARLLPVLFLLVIAARLFVPPLRAANPNNPFVSWCCSQKGNLDRAAVLARLDRLPGRHLVFVTYRPDHVFTYEWVYNEADIDRAKVVWSRDLGTESNRQLIRLLPRSPNLDRGCRSAPGAIDRSAVTCRCPAMHAERHQEDLQEIVGGFVSGLAPSPEASDVPTAASATG